MTTIFPVVFYGSETWSVTLREKHRLKLTANSFLKIFGPKRYELVQKWRIPRSKKVYDLYSSPNIIRVIKSTRMRWAAHVARMLEEELHARVWWGNLRERDDVEDKGVVERIILKGNIKKWVVKFI
jgi:hypothetical protein